MAKPEATRQIMLVAGEASGDLLATELVRSLRSRLAPAAGAHPVQFFGAGGVRMAEAGVELAFDMTRHAVIGIWDVLKNIVKFRRLMRQLIDLAAARRPDAIICVDFSGFNRRFARAIREQQRHITGWNPRIVQFVSPQVWASRPGRAIKMARDFDLLLSIFPFEKQWYAEHAPAMRVEFVGHPMIDRHGPAKPPGARTQGNAVLLLPGSRTGELRRHLPVMLAAATIIRASSEARFRLVLPDEGLLPLARELTGSLPDLQIQVGNLAVALAESTIALASTGTVTMECAWFGVPTVTLYKTNWLTYEIGRRIVTVKSLTMPNLLAGETVYPEFVQHEATPGHLAQAALALLNSPDDRDRIQKKLAAIIQSLGEPGACDRAAGHIAGLLDAS